MDRPVAQGEEGHHLPGTANRSGASPPTTGGRRVVYDEPRTRETWIKVGPIKTKGFETDMAAGREKGSAPELERVLHSLSARRGPAQRTGASRGRNRGHGLDSYQIALRNNTGRPLQVFVHYGVTGRQMGNPELSRREWRQLQRITFVLEPRHLLPGRGPQLPRGRRPARDDRVGRAEVFQDRDGPHHWPLDPHLQPLSGATLPDRPRGWGRSLPRSVLFQQTQEPINTSVPSTQPRSIEEPMDGHPEIAQQFGDRQLVLRAQDGRLVVHAVEMRFRDRGSRTTTLRTPAFRYSPTLMTISRQESPGERTSMTSSGTSGP